MTAFSRLLLILATAVLYGLSFPPYGSALVAWFALVPFLLTMRGLSATAALAWAWMSGAQRLASVEALPAGDVPIAVVQGNVDLGARWDRTLYGANLEDYLKQTAAAAETPEPDTSAPAMVSWPENAVTFFPDEEPLCRESIARVLQGLLARIGARLDTTPYGRWGDVFVGLCVLALLLAAFREPGRAR